MTFRDTLDITVQGGRGGDGAMSFLRLKYIAKGGPDGGRGGRGGSILLRAVDDVGALAKLTPHKTYRADVGKQGEGRNKNGKHGKDMTLNVPVGTVARDADTGEIIADLLEIGQTAVVASGGEGGRGNASFASAIRRTPRFAEFGAPGTKRRLRLELRTIADAGLVGYPNAGKSSLLAALSNARPEIADYPFTTLTPNLGVVEREGRGFERFTLADVPGLIEGASEGKGLGLEFLRHISRTRLLVWVLDISEEPLEAYNALRREVEAYDPTLLELPGLIVLHKIDLAAESEIQDAQHELAVAGLPIVAASSLENVGIDEVRAALFDLLPERPALAPSEPTTTVVRTEPLVVTQEDEGWRITGSEVEPLVARFDTENPEAVTYLHRHFEGMGLAQLMRRAGVKNGDDVRIGDAEFEYFDEQAVPEENVEQEEGDVDFDFDDASEVAEDDAQEPRESA